MNTIAFTPPTYANTVVPKQDRASWSDHTGNSYKSKDGRKYYTCF